MQCLLYIAQSATRTLLGTQRNVMQKLAILPCYASPPNLKCLPPPLDLCTHMSGIVHATKNKLHIWTQEERDLDLYPFEQKCPILKMAEKGTPLQVAFFPGMPLVSIEMRSVFVLSVAPSAIGAYTLFVSTVHSSHISKLADPLAPLSLSWKRLGQL